MSDLSAVIAETLHEHRYAASTMFPRCQCGWRSPERQEAHTPLYEHQAEMIAARLGISERHELEYTIGTEQKTVQLFDWAELLDVDVWLLLNGIADV